MTEQLAFEIYWDDLTAGAQERFMNTIGDFVHEDYIVDFKNESEPLAVILFENED